jgi:hypothetical protein
VCGSLVASAMRRASAAAIAIVDCVEPELFKHDHPHGEEWEYCMTPSRDNHNARWHISASGWRWGRSGRAGSAPIGGSCAFERFRSPPKDLPALPRQPEPAVSWPGRAPEGSWST